MKKSFTLIELLVGLGMFLFLLIALQAFIGAIFSSSFRALAMKRLADSTRTSLEIMGREIRLAAASGGALAAPCDTIIAGQSFDYTLPITQLRFLNFENNCITYEFSGGKITKQINAGSPQDFLGGGGVTVESASFTLAPSLWVDPPVQQDKVTINITVNTNDPTAANQELEIDLQTTVSQREI